MKRTIEQRTAFITRMIKKHGSAYSAANAMGITPSAFYDRMNRLGMKPEGYKPLKGEPEKKGAKKKWLKDILEKHEWNISAAARSLKISTTALRSRMDSYGIKNARNAEARRKEFTRAFRASKRNVAKTAEALGITVSAVYERMDRYDLTTPLQDKLAKEAVMIG